MGGGNPSIVFYFFMVSALTIEKGRNIIKMMRISNRKNEIKMQ